MLLMPYANMNIWVWVTRLVWPAHVLDALHSISTKGQPVLVKSGC